ncbi:MAG: diacylglycerol kinase family lipid kinase [Clostridia bacterium]|nr:diacylglycerol kinase family lipid kinase [Clostridia bacterium]
MSDTLLIINQKAGRGTPGNNIIKIVDAFSQKGLMPEIYLTQSKGDAFHIAKQKASEYKKIVCYGGDGTLDEVTSGILKSGSRPIVGYIPAGSTNDFAKSLELPDEPDKAAEIAISGREFACDIGALNGDYFVYVAAFGLFTEVSYKTDQDMKNLLGHMAYILEGAKSLFDIRPYSLKIELDDELIEDNFIFGMISNSRSVGGFKNITGTDIEFDDGKFEVVLIKHPRNAIELNRIIPNLLTQKSDDLVYFRKASNIKIISDTEVAWTLDGEDGGKHTEAEISVYNRMIDILVP